MSPTVQHNDRILVNKFMFDSSQLKRNDLAVYLSTGPNPQMNLKRVVGLPGDTVEIRDELLFINGVAAPENRFVFFDETASLHPDLTNFGPINVPRGSCFMLGDNRRRSFDSRFLGSIPFENFTGVARLIYWSNDYTFGHDYPASQPIRGAIRWDRIGLRLD